MTDEEWNALTEWWNSMTNQERQEWIRGMFQ